MRANETHDRDPRRPLTPRHPSKPKRWFPIEASPAVLDAYAGRLGLSSTEDGASYAFVDVLGLEPWALALVPSPVVAVLLLFPKNPEAVAREEAEAARLDRVGQVVSPGVFFMRQTIGNACGAIGLLHALGNLPSPSALTFAETSFLGRFFGATRGQTPEAIAAFLEADAELERIHEDMARAGQSAQLADVDDPIETHFVCFSAVDGHLYELDGDKTRPINHGPTTPERLLSDACGVIAREFLAHRDRDDVRFAIMALVNR